MSKIQSLLADYENALTRFEEVLRQEKNEFIRDSAIKRFELVFDLSWKTLKTFLEEYHNAHCHSPRNCFKEAFLQGIIEYDTFWMEVINLRNEVAHIYNSAFADRMYQQLPDVLVKYKKMFSRLKDEIARSQVL